MSTNPKFYEKENVFWTKTFQQSLKRLKTETWHVRYSDPQPKRGDAA